MPEIKRVWNDPISQTDVARYDNYVIFVIGILQYQTIWLTVYPMFWAFVTNAIGTFPCTDSSLLTCFYMIRIQEPVSLEPTTLLNLWKPNCRQTTNLYTQFNNKVSQTYN